MNTLYRIHWKSLLTGKTGQGVFGFPKDQAQLICDEQNKKFAFLQHWIEAIDS